MWFNVKVCGIPDHRSQLQGSKAGPSPSPLTVSSPHGVEEYILTLPIVSTRASPFHPRSQYVHAQFFRTLKTAACKPVLNEIHLHVRVVSTENNSHFLHFHHRRHLHFHRQYLQVSVKWTRKGNVTPLINLSGGRGKLGRGRGVSSCLPWLCIFSYIPLSSLSSIPISSYVFSFYCLPSLRVVIFSELDFSSYRRVLSYARTFVFTFLALTPQSNLVHYSH